MIIRKIKTVIEFSVTKTADYDLNQEYASIKEYSDKFADNVDVDNYVLTKDKKLYVNGKLLGQTSIGGVSTLGDAGGVPEFSHYYSSDYNNYYFASYSDIDFTVPGPLSPAGSHVSKYATVSNPLFYAAKSSVDSFEASVDDFYFNFNAFLVAAGLTVATWETILGLIAAGGAAAISGAAAIDSFYDAEEDIGDAYNYIVNL